MNPEEQLKEVQSVLDRLTKFRYVNGWAAVVAGLLCTIAYFFVCTKYSVPFVVDSMDANQIVSFHNLISYAIILGGLLVISAVACGAIILLSLPQDLTGAAWRNLIRLIGLYAIYVIAGAAVLWSVLSNSRDIDLGILRTVPPMMCIFYGLAQLHASQISLPALKYLGLWLLICGGIGSIQPQIGWFFWLIGFGVGHIITGLYIVNRNKA